MQFSPSIQRLSWFALAGGALLLAVGLVSISEPHLLVHVRAYEFLRWSLIALLAAWPLARALKLHLASALALVWLAAHVAMVGLVPVVAVGLMAVAALAIGTRIDERGAVDPAVALVLGLALIAACIGWLLPLHIHSMWIYLPALVGVAGWRRAKIAVALGTAAAQWRSAVRASPRMATVAIAALGIVSIASWVPTMMSDDLAYHLALPTQLQQLGYYRMDPATQVWALAPWASDVLHGIAQVTADREARGSVNLMWLCAAAWLLFRVCRASGLTPTGSWLGVGLAASQPMTGALMVSMQTELPATAVLLACVTLILRSEANEGHRSLLPLAILAGLLLQLKISFAVPLFWLGLWLALRWRGHWPWRQLPRALLVGAAVGGASYAYAWGLAGNPLLPLFNHWFESPYFAIEPFYDDRYGRGLAIDWLWQLVLHTKEVNEGWSGAGGFQFLTLAGLLPLAVLAQSTRALTLVALAIALTMYALMHYLRYIYPALVLLTPGLLLGLSMLARNRVALGTGIGLLLLNLVFLSNSSWPLRNGTVRSLLAEHGNPHKVLEKNVPERLLVSAVDRRARVLIVGPPYHAPFAGRAFVANWYDQELLHWSGQLASAGNPATLQTLIGEYGFTHVLIGRHAPIADLPARLEAIGAVSIAQANDAILWQLPATDPSVRPRDLMRERDLARRLQQPWH